jgi:hypothetical protein
MASAVSSKKGAILQDHPHTFPTFPSFEANKKKLASRKIFTVLEETWRSYKNGGAADAPRVEQRKVDRVRLGARKEQWRVTNLATDL